MANKVAPFFRPLSSAADNAIRDGLRTHYYAGQAGMTTADIEADLEAHALSRYRFSCNRWVPWVSNFVDVQGARVAEIGSGTGSITCAFAGVAKRVCGYDIDEGSTNAARLRADALGLDNVEHFCATPDALPEIVRTHANEPFDIVSLYATLEHQTLEERQNTLRLAWDILRDGGVIVVGQTPNLLTYYHPHTSRLPFFDMLPDTVKFQYLDLMPASHFKDVMTKARDDATRDAEMELTRWGRGMSFHEFEIALHAHAKLSDLVVGHGFEPEILEFNPIEPEEKLLMSFLFQRGMNVPIAFARRWLTLVIRKPGPGLPAPEPLFDVKLLRALSV